MHAREPHGRLAPLPSGHSLRFSISKLAPRWSRHTTRSPLVRVRVMADSHRSALRSRGRPRGRHARLIVRYFAREVPFVMGSLQTVWAARRAQCSHAIMVSFLVSQALIRGGGVCNSIGRCLVFSQDAGIVRVVGLRGQRTTSARSVSAGTSEPTNELEKPIRALRCDSHAMVASRDV